MISIDWLTSVSTTDAVTARDSYNLLPAAPVNSDVGGVEKYYNLNLNHYKSNSYKSDTPQKWGFPTPSLAEYSATYIGGLKKQAAPERQINELRVCFLREISMLT